MLPVYRPTSHPLHVIAYRHSPSSYSSSSQELSLNLRQGPNQLTPPPLSLADKNELSVAKTYLEQAAASNLPEFLKALSDIIVQQQCSDVARMAAGLQLKNHLTSKDSNTKQEYTERWLQFPPDTREYIKNNVSRSTGLHLISYVSL